MKKFIQDYNTEFIETISAIKVKDIQMISQLIEERQGKNNIYMIGNGGSAASASHWVCDFNKGTELPEGEKIRMFSLVDNTPSVTALGNDISYEDIFLEQLKCYLSPNDLVIGLSVSGNSSNIVRALAYAQESKTVTASIVGDYGGEMIKYSDYPLVIPSKNYGIVEDMHMYLCHVISQFICNKNK